MESKRSILTQYRHQVIFGGALAFASSVLDTSAQYRGETHGVVDLVIISLRVSSLVFPVLFGINNEVATKRILAVGVLNLALMSPVWLAKNEMLVAISFTLKAISCVIFILLLNRWIAPVKGD